MEIGVCRLNKAGTNSSTLVAYLGEWIVQKAAQSWLDSRKSSWPFASLGDVIDSPSSLGFSFEKVLANILVRKLHGGTLKDVFACDGLKGDAFWNEKIEVVGYNSKHHVRSISIGSRDVKAYLDKPDDCSLEAANIPPTYQLVDILIRLKIGEYYFIISMQVKLVMRLKNPGYAFMTTDLSNYEESKKYHRVIRILVCFPAEQKAKLVASTRTTIPGRPMEYQLHIGLNQFCNMVTTDDEEVSGSSQLVTILSAIKNVIPPEELAPVVFSGSKKRKK